MQIFPSRILRGATLFLSSIACLFLVQALQIDSASAAEPTSWTDTRFGGGSDTQVNEGPELEHVTSISISGNGQYRAYIRKYEPVMYSKDGGVTYNNISNEVKGQIGRAHV